MEKAMGTRTSVHVGCLLQEYSQISQRDTDLPGNYQIVGSSGLSMLSNRLSWFYDFKGPSMTVDTACSGSLLALHLGCQDLLSGTVDMASPSIPTCEKHTTNPDRPLHVGVTYLWCLTPPHFSVHST
jgi:hypothetical protein